MAQSLWVGLGGIALAFPLIFAIAAGGDVAGARVSLPPWLFASGSLLTLLMALTSGLAALRRCAWSSRSRCCARGRHMHTHSEPALFARHLERSFGSGNAAVSVVRDVSLELHQGETILMMGPSGSGKSTLLAVLSGLLRPDRGEVIVLGKHLWRMSERAREQFRRQHFGFVFQGFNLFPSLTAREQLEMVVRWGERASRPRGSSSGWRDARPARPGPPR